MTRCRRSSVVGSQFGVEVFRHVINPHIEGVVIPPDTIGRRPLKELHISAWVDEDYP